MKGATRFGAKCMLLAIGGTLAGWLLALPLQLSAQNTCSGTQGQNGVYNPTCNNGSPGVVGSSAFIDASMFPAGGRDFCGVLKAILTSTSYPPAGAVIDARGLPGATGTSMTCSASPWAGISNPPPSTILLPAGTIIIPGTWVLPNYTRLVGAGDALDYLSTGTVSVGTTLQACKSSINGCSFNSNETDMIDLGTSPLCGPACNSVSVENLTLDGLGQSLSSPQCLVS